MKIKKREGIVRVGVFSSSRESSARLVEVGRQPEGDEEGKESIRQQREGDAMEKHISARERVMLKLR